MDLKIKLILFIIFIILLALSMVLFFKYMGIDMKKQKAVQNDLLIRQPAVSGMFYSADKEILSKQINAFLKQAEDVKIKGDLKILILPHAGYEYSGQVAAYGFKKLINKDFKTVVLIGPSHHNWFDGSSVFQHGIWQTPLGQVQVDSLLGEKLTAENEKIFFQQESHQQEHCLEIMLPFLQKVLKQFKIVPIVMGQPSIENVRILARALKKHIDKDTLIIISSDLSHYPAYQIANDIDNKTIEAILTGSIDSFDQSIQESMDQKLPGLGTTACGAEPIKVALILAQSMEIENIKLLKYANSGDVAGDHSRVVGYAAISFSKIKNRLSAEKTSDENRQILLNIARQSIESHLRDKKIPEFKNIPPELKKPQGAFVTLKKHGQLRGCIGRIIEEKQPLYQVVSEMAVAAAVEDRRFVPVNIHEMKDIEIEISILSPMKKIKDPFKEIELGKHGVIIQKGIHSGVFLPQVATDSGWDLEKFMSHLSKDKAGLDKNAWKTSEVDIYVFTAEVFE